MVGRPAWCHIVGEKKVSTLSHVLLKGPLGEADDVAVNDKPQKVALLTEVLSYFDTQNDVDISLVEVGDCTQGQMQVIQARF